MGLPLRRHGLTQSIQVVQVVVGGQELVTGGTDGGSSKGSARHTWKWGSQFPRVPFHEVPTAAHSGPQAYSEDASFFANFATEDQAPFSSLSQGLNQPCSHRPLPPFVSYIPPRMPFLGLSKVSHGVSP